MKYEKKRETIDVIRYTGRNKDEIISLAKGKIKKKSGDIVTLIYEFDPGVCETQVFVGWYVGVDELGEVVVLSDDMLAYEYVPVVDSTVLEEKTDGDFGWAIEHLKRGFRLARSGWNGKGMFVVYQKGYPEGIPANKNTSEAFGIPEGELFKCEPYLQIRMVNGSHSMWVPSINDCLAEDWRLV